MKVYSIENCINLMIEIISLPPPRKNINKRMTCCWASFILAFMMLWIALSELPFTFVTLSLVSLISSLTSTVLLLLNMLLSNASPKFPIDLKSKGAYN